jgi:serine/threonine-protein kinase TNNI3K
MEGFVMLKDLPNTTIVTLWQNVETKQEVAMKQFPPIANAEEEFKGEANSLFRLRHPLILRFLFCVLPHGGIGPRIVTEYLGGGSLADILKDPIRWWTATRKAITVAGIVVAMKYVHACSLIHRDLKPANILFDDDHQVRIADFGSSRIYALDVTMRRSVGTPLYMAPELFDGREPRYDQKVDVYSFGLILFEVAVGGGILSTPEGIRSAWAFLKRKGGRPEIPSTVLSPVSALIRRCWSEDPASRPSFAEIFEILEGMNYEIVQGVRVTEVRAFLSLIEEEVRIGGG